MPWFDLSLVPSRKSVYPPDFGGCNALKLQIVIFLAGRVMHWPMLAMWLARGHPESQQPIPFFGTWVRDQDKALEFRRVHHRIIINFSGLCACAKVRTFLVLRTSAREAL